MRVIATILGHYGAEYAKESVAACESLVDQFIVLYTPQGSQGHRTNARCPESEDRLRACFDSVSDRLVWHRGEYASEGQHRGMGYQLANGADLILQHDCDEVWNTEDLKRCISEAAAGTARLYSINGFTHFWRSFNWCCRDVWQPMRIIKPAGNGEASLSGCVYHMSYAQGLEISRYKWEVSGHRSELRRDWWEKKFLANAKEDIHPTTLNWWNAEPFDKSTLPESLKAHPNYAKEIIC